MIAIMMLMVLAVIATSAGVLVLFFRHLQKIETELWGVKQAEAAQTAENLTATPEEKI